LDNIRGGEGEGSLQQPEFRKRGKKKLSFVLFFLLIGEGTDRRKKGKPTIAAKIRKRGERKCVLANGETIFTSNLGDFQKKKKELPLYPNRKRVKREKQGDTLSKKERRDRG